LHIIQNLLLLLMYLHHIGHKQIDYGIFLRARWHAKSSQR